MNYAEKKSLCSSACFGDMGQRSKLGFYIPFNSQGLVIWGNKLKRFPIHLFCQCESTKALWINIEKWITQGTNISVKLSLLDILFGYLNLDNFILLNTIT